MKAIPELRSLYIDLLDPKDEAPKPGDYLMSRGRKTRKVGTRYLVVEARQVKRRIPTTRRRIQMQVQVVDEIGDWTKKIFDFYWYPRKKRTVNFEQYMKRGEPHA